MDLILNSIKRLLGISEEDESFNFEIILHINSAFFTLMQLGIGPPEGFSLPLDEDEAALVTWEDFLDEKTDLQSLQSYIYLRARLLFDPPQMGYLVDAITKQISELEWRLNVQAEGVKDND